MRIPKNIRNYIVNRLNHRLSLKKEIAKLKDLSIEELKSLLIAELKKNNDNSLIEAIISDLI